MVSQQKNEKDRCGDEWNHMTCTLEAGHPGLHVDAARNAASDELLRALRWEKVSQEHIDDDTAESIAHAVVQAFLQALPPGATR